MCVQVDTFNESELITSLSEAKLSPPFIVKPQVACGVADAHSMVLIFISFLSLIMQLQLQFRFK